ncbi:MAG: type IV pilus assembly protein PilM [Pirellulales bacterium]|nr:type IV pilus assembly protein PilM [Pirellulales bacterium]
MAKSNAVWGIDIGQCALKALRCRPHEKDDSRMVVEAFDYIEYPKILTQPEANRDELVREALELFVSRNDIAGESVAVAVPGQSGLARFIKLPPVERKKIPDIVKYEARQQIPFALEDVVWDYQPLIGNEEEGYALETEVGLFAMKRDQVARHLKPLESAGIAVEIIQLAPLAIYNFICYDRLQISGPYDPSNPPPSTVIISLGTDTTDLVITNGYRVWQRSIPIGGNHFTKSLTKELKLTFAKAEHLKRNAMKAENPKAVFQAMRPVFSDLVAEIQRSIGFFTSNNRNAKLGDMVALGNPMKLPGLQRFLSQNLDQEVKLIDQFNNLVGGTAVAGPQFKENQPTFGVAYGLCVQALGNSQLRTNLLPEEIVTTRLVKAKKPWAVGAAALLLLGLTINYFGHYSALMTADVAAPAMARELSAAKNAVSEAKRFEGELSELKTKFDAINEVGNSLQSNVEGRLLWLELLKALDASLPKDPRPAAERQETEEDIAKRNELHIDSVDCEYFADLTPWHTSVAANLTQKPGASPSDGSAPTDPNASPPADPSAAAPPADPAGAPPLDPSATVGTDPNAPPPADGATGTGLAAGGWVIEIKGFHLHNNPPNSKIDVGDEGEQFVRNTLIKHLEEGKVMLPDGPSGKLIEMPISELGVQYPVVVTSEKVKTVTYMAEAMDATATGGIGPAGMAMGPRGMGEEAGGLPYGTGAAGEQLPKTFKLRQYDFVVQFCWQPKPRTERMLKLAAKEKAPAPQGEVATDATATEPATAPATAEAQPIASPAAASSPTGEAPAVPPAIETAPTGTTPASTGPAPPPPAETAPAGTAATTTEPATTEPSS